MSKKQCKKIGIIGGAGPYASALLYEMIIAHCYENNSASIPEIVLLNYPFTRGLKQEESAKNGALLKKEVQYCLNFMQLNGVNIAAIACNTLHFLLDGIDLQGIQLVHLPELVKENIQKSKMQRLLLLGTPTTLKSSLYSQTGVDFLHPNKEEQGIVDTIIDRILEGKILESDALGLSELILQIQSQKPFDGVVLGCTELPVLRYKHGLNGRYRIFDSIQILAETLSTLGNKP